MRVLHIAKTTGHGGVCTAVSDMCRALSDHGISSRVLYLADVEHDRIRADFAAAGTPCRVTSRSFHAGIAMLIARIQSSLSPRSEQIIHFHSGMPVLRPALSTLGTIAGTRTPIAITLHGAADSLPASLRAQSWEYHAQHARRWPLIMVPSEAELAIHSSVLDNTDSYRVIPYCIFPPVHEIGGLRRMLKDQSNNTLIVGVGRLHESKGFDTLIRAFGIIGQALPDCTLAIFGEGPERDRLEKIIAGFPAAIGSRIHLLGHTQAPARYLRDADLFVSASHAESFGLIAFEAALAERPCVLSSISPWTSIFREDEDCLFAPKGDSSAFAEQILLLLADRRRAERLGSTMHSKVSALTSPDGVAKKWIAAYQSLLGR